MDHNATIRFFPINKHGIMLKIDKAENQKSNPTLPTEWKGEYQATWGYYNKGPCWLHLQNQYD